MQLKIYQRLNQILIGLIISIIVVLTLVIINFKSFDSSIKIIVIVGFFAFTILSFFGFKMLEYNWDKYLIQKMILKGQVALAEIVTSTPLYPIKDSASHFYRLWQFDMIIKDTELQTHKLTLYEKMNYEVKTIPTGNVYVTYDPEKPKKLFIIPNGMIGRFTNLMPLVSFYEKANLNIKYLDVIDDKGLVIRTYKDSL
ncbi:MAG: hypothetical protein PHP11_01360, partial [Erysipelotrichaceae bacterium]|nr:hypothetical protein [Erysipelotrichaceae bacterium]MDD4642642.1 hypothetical protein [Erysipelotrichaceae bacterium]